MLSAAAYVLRVPEDRREILLGDTFLSPAEYARHWRDFWAHGESVAEPVPHFDHSRRVPLIVFASFSEGFITHIGDGRKGAPAGTGLVRLNLTMLQPLVRFVSFNEIVARASARVRKPLDRILNSGGKLPPKSTGVLVEIILGIEPGLAQRLSRFSQQRAERLGRFTARARSNLAEQKETLSTALALAGLEMEEVLAWSPPQEEPRTFLEGIPQAHLREDAALVHDYSDVPGFEFVKQYQFAAREFLARSDPSVRLKVVMANRLPLEKQTGADLIYYNETYKSFVMVQYKAMNQGASGPEFRWTAEDKLAEEIERMEVLLKALALQPEDRSAIGFRLHANPFFLKLCPRLIFNPDDKGLSKGMYFPLEYWKALALDPVTKGPREGRVVTYANVARRLSNPHFLTLVQHAWVGTTVPQSQLLQRVIESVIESGKTLTLAVKSTVPAQEEEAEDEGYTAASEDLGDLLGQLPP